eukprot:1713540-Amphidinium_carterae.1
MEALGDGATTTAETSTTSSTIPQPVPIFYGGKQSHAATCTAATKATISSSGQCVADKTMDFCSSDTSSIAEEVIVHQWSDRFYKVPTTSPRGQSVKGKINTL